MASPENRAYQDRIEAGANPGGLVAHMYVNGRLVDASPLTEETTSGIASQHATFAVESAPVGAVVVVRIFDGDTGALMAVLDANSQ
ncbi:MAG TPA: hypothetical protein VGH66_03250 [Acidimicrobiales bacterium]|jgi:hypothetical protein